MVWLLILCVVFTTAAGHSLRQGVDIRKADGRRHLDAQRGGNQELLPISVLDTSTDAGRAGDMSATSTGDSTGNPFSWLFGAPPVQMAGPATQAAVPVVMAPMTPAPMMFPQPTQTLPAMKLVPATQAPPAPPPPPPPPVPYTVPPIVVDQMRGEIAELRKEVAAGNKDMWNAVKLITSTVEKDEQSMQALTQDVQTLRGRHAGSVPLVADECSMRQSSCSECLSVSTCVWCKVEQRCYRGDALGPVRGECTFFRHGTCN